VYGTDVDKSFLAWLDDDNTANVEKTIPGMINSYRHFHCLEYGKEEEEQLSDEGIRRHLFQLLKQNGYNLRYPKIVDAKRCITYETLEDW